MSLSVEPIEEHRRGQLPQVRPLIAVTTSEVREGTAVTPTRHGEPPQLEMALGLKYLHAIEAAGGIPVVVPPLQIDCIDPLLDRVAGLCLSGGPDLDPDAYGERRHTRTGPTERQLDVFELALAKAADARRMPILAVCRGMQLLNVARGGTLHQHLPDIVGERIVHRQSEAGERPTHWVTLAPGTRLRQILDRGRTKVNSFHHQAIAELGAGLTVTSRASDGTVESVEAVDREFVVGVQWHAECLIDRFGQAALFRTFIDAASQFDEAAARFADVA
ncbi:MAG TPA: gamma-glutamyl-gamma-aminobutyrate hydrolase family protein [Solirubrobacteraceae bacterium]|jgi:putative glutamine amidotransferase|nr:gamma-glutamyl-gamma-aminobutyrate hydrolase family protein [Solirubrobacteraceae bacterium]